MTAIIVLWIILGLIALIVVLLHFSVSVEVKGGTNSDFVLKIKYMGFTVYPRPPKKKKKKSPKPKVKKKTDDTFEEFKDDLEDDFDGGEDLLSDTEQIADFSEISQKEEIERLSETAENTMDIGGDKPADSPTGQSKFGNKAVNKFGKKAVKEKKTKAVKRKKEKSKKTDSKTGGRLDGLKRKYNIIKPYIPMGWKYFKKFLKTIRFTNTKIDIVTGKEDAYESAMFYGKVQAALFNILAVISGIFTVKLKKADVHCVFNEKKLEANGETVVKVRPSTMIAIAVCIGVSFLKIFLRERREKKRAEKAEQSKKQDSNEKSENGGNAA